mmetsp:Transcript_31933/g.85482  ORF Transcript_31933/g.85482 Transcript_31933/m.85482 type:complete len:218 (-) Transcript_31933:587-1240(-)
MKECSEDCQCANSNCSGGEGESTVCRGGITTPNMLTTLGCCTARRASHSRLAERSAQSGTAEKFPSANLLDATCITTFPSASRTTPGTTFEHRPLPRDLRWPLDTPTLAGGTTPRDVIAAKVSNDLTSQARSSAFRTLVSPSCSGLVFTARVCRAGQDRNLLRACSNVAAPTMAPFGWTLAARCPTSVLLGPPGAFLGAGKGGPLPFPFVCTVVIKD